MCDPVREAPLGKTAGTRHYLCLLGEHRQVGGDSWPCLCSVRPGRSPAGARCTMAAASFVQEMRSMGEKLLLKLQKLPQAEPVEIAAFSVILLFTATVLLLLLIAGCCCCCPERRGRKVQVRPMSPP
ncbi:small integral membrane protein 5 isoform X1 [Suricata suricatta]|nr:small integral membrane protein 5 isoform X1 [Suricata suricatta]XP_029783000.1 small integral membrane protein 5 isoform X1 [Suricata suricatta]